MTAQHAQRQGKAAARNVAATFGRGTRKPYKHRDLGSVVDLGGWQAVANPLHVALSGPLASAAMPKRPPPLPPAPPRQAPGRGRAFIAQTGLTPRTATALDTRP